MKVTYKGNCDIREKITAYLKENAQSVFNNKSVKIWHIGDCTLVQSRNAFTLVSKFCTSEPTLDAIVNKIICVSGEPSVHFEITE
ncbi:hypothetical protein HY486_04660 [Candidatus Woesearchaeota archaeon]|nr:hypothetical protein [Candidatus Woesearchaeota archaeon]